MKKHSGARTRFYAFSLFSFLIFTISANAQKALILDKTMRPAQALETVAKTWTAVGCSIDYRPFHPYLTLADTSQYDILIMLCGRTPLLASAEITQDEIDLLLDFHRKGRGVVFGYVPGGTGDGAHDRAAINAFLQQINARVQIAEMFVYDNDNQYATGGGGRIFAHRRDSWSFSAIGRVPLGHMTPLRISPDARTEIFAESSETSFVQKGRLQFNGPFPTGLFIQGEGPVLLLPRTALSSSATGIHGDDAPFLQPDFADSSRVFLQSVVERFKQLLSGQSLELSPIDPTPTLPIQHKSEFPRLALLETAPSNALLPSETVAFSNSVQNTGTNGGAASPDLAGSSHKALKGLLINPGETGGAWKKGEQFLKTAGLNFLIGESNSAMLEESRFFGLKDLALDASEFEKEVLVGADGLEVKTWHPLNRRVWREAFFSALHQNDHGQFSGFFLDLQTLENPLRFEDFSGFDFGDRSWMVFLNHTGSLLENSVRDEALETPAAARFSWLLTKGYLPLYRKALMDEAERFGIELRRESAGRTRDGLWAIALSSMPRDWFTIGLLRGLSRPSKPVILLTLETQVRKKLAWLRQHDVHAVHLLAITPMKYRREDYPKLMQLAKTEHNGFWILASEKMLGSGGVQCGEETLSLEDYGSLLKDSWAAANAQ